MTAARLAARTLQVSAHGTLGVLLRATRRRQRTPEEILNVLNALPVRSTLHIKRELLDEIIQQVKELM
jgi:predicted nucleic acid-binding protein